MNVRRYQKWAKSGLAIMLAGAMMVGTAASGGGMTAQAAETESSDTVSTHRGSGQGPEGIVGVHRVQGHVG